MQLEAFYTTKLRDRYKIAILISLVLAIYLPGLNSGFFVFDDFDIVKYLEGVSLHEAANFFGLPKGGYWRPLTMLSLLFDVSLFKVNSSLMHLHNILLHAMNTVLVFHIVHLLLERQKQGHEWPMVAAALFAIHPVNTESVNWIAGRTDLLACVFALTGVYLFLLSIRSHHMLFSWLSALALLLGCMAKEAPFPLLPATLLSLFIIKDWQFLTGAQKTRIKTLSQGIPFLVCGSAYLCIRTLGLENISQGFDKIIGGTAAKGPFLSEQIHTGVVALGFYLKKLFIPAPLNFAIDHVSSFYLWLGLVAIIICSFLIFMRTLTSLLVLFILCTISPAILNAIYHIAWTPYAERYLYLPSAFFCIGLCTWNKSSRLSFKLSKSLILLITIFYLSLTIHRNLQWKTPVKILANAIWQNPDNINLLINHAIVLVDEKGPAAARHELNRILLLEPNNQVAFRNLALISLRSQDDPGQARKDLNVFFNGTLEPEAKTLLIMIEANEKFLEKSYAEESLIISHELFLSNRKYYQLANKPAYLFAAFEKAATAEERESLRNLLLTVSNNISLADSVRAKADNLIAGLCPKKPQQDPDTE